MERPVEILEAIAQKRGCVQRGNEIDYSKAAALVTMISDPDVWDALHWNCRRRTKMEVRKSVRLRRIKGNNGDRITAVYSEIQYR